MVAINRPLIEWLTRLVLSGVFFVVQVFSGLPGVAFRLVVLMIWNPIWVLGRIWTKRNLFWKQGGEVPGWYKSRILRHFTASQVVVAEGRLLDSPWISSQSKLAAWWTVASILVTVMHEEHMYIYIYGLCLGVPSLKSRTNHNFQALDGGTKTAIRNRAPRDLEVYKIACNEAARCLWGIGSDGCCLKKATTIGQWWKLYKEKIGNLEKRYEPVRCDGHSFYTSSKDVSNPFDQHGLETTQKRPTHDKFEVFFSRTCYCDISDG